MVSAAASPIGVSRLPTPISLSTPHVFSLDRDPTVPPPDRASHLPISSQPEDEAEAGPSSSPIKGTTSSSLISNHLHIERADTPEMDRGGGEDEEDPEFAGMEVIGATQWEREKPTFHKRKSSSVADQEEDYDRLVNEAQDWDEEEERFATRSPVAGPSSPLRTPAFSLAHTSSDLPSGAYLQTPQTPRDRASTPISWSPSPLSSRGHGPTKRGSLSQAKKRKQKTSSSNIDPGRSLIELSDDSDNDRASHENDENLPPPMVVRNDPPTVRKGLGRRMVLDSDDEQSMIKKDVKGKGKGKEKDRDEEGVYGLSSDVPLDLDLVGNDNGGLGRRMQDRLNDTQYSEFDDFPFDAVDLSMTSPILSNKRDHADPGQNTTTNNRRVTRLSQKSPVHTTSKLEDLFADDDEVIPDPSPRLGDSTSGHFGRMGPPVSKSKSAGRNTSHVNMFDLSASALDFDPVSDSTAVSLSTSVSSRPGRRDPGPNTESEWYIPLIPDLPEKWAEFYLNHWRRGADKSNACSTDKRRGEGIVSDDEDEAEYEDRMASTARGKKTGGRGTASRSAGPAKRGKWAPRGGWRGRGRGKAVARKR